MSTLSQPREKATYVAPQLDESWLSNVQRKLYAQSKENLDYVFCKLWGLITDPRNLRAAFARVSRNRGRNTAGVDKVTVRKLLHADLEAFIAETRAELRSGAYRPSPVRRVLIPKAGQPGKFRALGIPTVKDRVIQAAVKNILEPIFEPDFYPCSYGFRPGRSVHAALEHLRLLMRPKKAERRLPYQWAIEGDIKACFDNINHHALMERIRRRVGDPKMSRLVVAFLKAGIMSEEQFLRSDAGTPQGGILSPLLANIALGVLEERYERHVWPRRKPTLRTDEREIEHRAVGTRDYDSRRGLPVFFPIRYADDFLLLVKAPVGPEQNARARMLAHDEREVLAARLRETLNLELSETKTLVTPVTERMQFLGHHVFVRPHPTSGRMVVTTVIPRERSQRLRVTIKRVLRGGTTAATLANRLKLLNPLLRGWAYFYRHAWGAKRVFARLDRYVWCAILRWLKKKHPRVGVRRLLRRYARRRFRSLDWRDGNVVRFEMRRIKVCQYKLGWMRPPSFASTPMESPVHSERCTPGLERDARKPAGENR
jgi:group II intron reverse transcriptase/maturase